MRMRRMRKRVMSLLTSVLLLIGMFPVPASAEETVVTEITMTGVHGPEVLAGGALLQLVPDDMTDISETPEYYMDSIVMLKSEDDGVEYPYEETDDEFVEQDMYYAALYTIRPADGLRFDPSIDALHLYGDYDEEDSVAEDELSYENLTVAEDMITFERYFGQASGEAELLREVVIDVPVPVSGEQPAVPENYAGVQDDAAAYYVYFDSWEGNFAEDGSFMSGETYIMPVTVQAEAGYMMLKETAVILNGQSCEMIDEDHCLGTLRLECEVSTDDGGPDVWEILTLEAEGGSVICADADGEILTEAAAGDRIYVQVLPDEGRSAEEVFGYMTDDDTQEIQIDYIEGDWYGFVMPEGAVTVGASFAGLPKAETPAAEFAADGPDSGRLLNVDENMVWSQDGENYSELRTDFAFDEIGPCTIYIVRLGDGENTSDSEPQILEITQYAAPEGIAAEACTNEKNNDGRITGLTAGLQWKNPETGSFEPVPADGGEWNGLTGGETYEFRYPEQGAVLASPSVTVEVPAYDGPAAEKFDIMIEGGKAYVDDEEAYNAIEGDTVAIKADDTEGRAFIKWVIEPENAAAADPENAETSFVMPGEPVAVKAVFEGDEEDKGFEYTVEFNGNGATSGSMEDQTFYEKEEQHLNLNTYAKTGYNFAGWSKGENGSVEYKDGENITGALVSKEGQIRTLYAVWKSVVPETEPQPTTKAPAPTQKPTVPPAQPTQPSVPPTTATMPTMTQTAESAWTPPTISPSRATVEESSPINVVVHSTESAQSSVSPTSVSPSVASKSPVETPAEETEQTEDQTVRRIRLVLGIAIGVVVAAIVVAVIFYQKEKKKHGDLF